MHMRVNKGSTPFMTLPRTVNTNRYWSIADVNVTNHNILFIFYILTPIIMAIYYTYLLHNSFWYLSNIKE